MTVPPPKAPHPPRLAWIEGIRCLGAPLLLLYYIQVTFTGSAYTPQPEGVMANLHQLLSVSGIYWHSWYLVSISILGWFGFQMVGVFVLISGFSLTLGLQTRRLRVGEFLQQRLQRLLWPLWAVLWLTYPFFSSLTRAFPDSIPSRPGVITTVGFPLLVDGDSTFPGRGLWWLVWLSLSYSLLFPWLHHLMRRWGPATFMVAGLVVTLAYRALALYPLAGHPSYVDFATPGGPGPFLNFAAQLSTFTTGMGIAQIYSHGRGPLFWSPGRALGSGLVLYGAGFISQFYTWGWLWDDLLVPPGLLLLLMVFSRTLVHLSAPLAQLFLKLGPYTYTYILLGVLILDSVLTFIVQERPWLYPQLLFSFLGGTLGLAIVVDYTRPTLRRMIMGVIRDLDYLLQRSPVSPRPSWYPRPGDKVRYQDQGGWTILKVEKLLDGRELYLCQVSNGKYTIWLNEGDLELDQDWLT